MSCNPKKRRPSLTFKNRSPLQRLSALIFLGIFNAVVFNSLIGNCDAHAKNFSLLMDGGSVRLAPLYDLVSTSAYPALANELAMKIGDERSPLRLTAKNWRLFFEQAGIGQAQARQKSLSMSDRVWRLRRIFPANTARERQPSCLLCVNHALGCAVCAGKGASLR